MLKLKENIFYTCLIFYSIALSTSMALMSIFGVLTLCAATYSLLQFKFNSSDYFGFKKQKETRIFFILTLFLVLSLLISLVLVCLNPPGFGGRFVTPHFLKSLPKLWYFLIPFLFAPAILKLEEKKQDRVLAIWLGTVALFSILSILQYFYGWPRPRMIPGYESRYHVQLFVGHHLSYASIFIFPFFSLLALSVYPPFKRSLRVLAFIFAFLLGLALLGTYSRMMWVALPIGVAIWILWVVPKKWSPILFTGYALGGYAVYLLPVVQRRLNDNMGIWERKEMWFSYIQFFKDNPFFGIGWQHNIEALKYFLIHKFPERETIFIGHAHNNFLEMLGSAGFFGALSWTLWCIGIFWIIFKGIKSNPFAKAWICAGIVFHLNGLTQVNFWDSKVMHTFFWIVTWSLVFLQRNKTPLDKTT